MINEKDSKNTNGTVSSRCAGIEFGLYERERHAHKPIFWCAAVARQTCWAVDCSFVCVGRIARFDGGVKALFEPVWTLGNRAPSQPGC